MNIRYLDMLYKLTKRLSTRKLRMCLARMLVRSWSHINIGPLNLRAIEGVPRANLDYLGRLQNYTFWSTMMERKIAAKFIKSSLISL